MEESNIEKKLTKLVKKMGGLCLKFISPGNAGVPDRIILLPGGVVRFVELKTETGRLAPIQRAWLTKLQKLGFDAQVLYGMEEVKIYAAGLEREGVMLDEATRLSEESGSESH